MWLLKNMTIVRFGITFWNFVICEIFMMNLDDLIFKF